MEELTSCKTAIENCQRTKTFSIAHLYKEEKAMDMHIHDCYELYYSISGGKQFLIDNRFYSIAPGDLFIINQYESHKLTQIDSCVHERIVLSVHPDFMKQISTEETDLDYCFKNRGDSFQHKISLNKEQQKRFLYYINKITSAEGFAHDIIERTAFMELMVLYAVSFALCTTNLNLAVSFGCRRRDFFWGCQGMLAVYTGISWLLKEGMYRLPTALGWSQGSRLGEMAQMMNLRGLLFPALALCLLALGAVSGLIFARSKVWGAVVIVAAVVLCMGAFILFVILNLTENRALLGRPATVTLAVMAAAFTAAAVFLWRFTGRYCVR